MKRFGSIILVAFLVVALAGFAFGQGAKAKDGVTIDVSGKMDLDYVYRDSVVTQLLSADTWTVGGDRTARADNFYNGKFTVRLDIGLSDGASAVLELENKRIDRTGGVTAPRNLGNDSIEVYFEQAYLKLNDLFTPKLGVTIGVQDVKIDVRGKGNPFFIDLTEAESMYSDAGLAVPGKHYDTLEPVGVAFNYKETDWTFEFGAFTASEGGSTGADENVYLFNLAYNLPKSVGNNSLLNFMAVLANGSDAVVAGDTDKDRAVWTFGLEADLNDVGNVAGAELFGGYFFQNGDAGRDGTGSTIDANGKAFYVGGRYTFAQMAGKPWVELAYWLLSGDKDSTDTKEDRFLSYENVDQFLILESDTFGLDIDTNYKAIKVSGGMFFDIKGQKDALNLLVNIGFFSFDENVASASASGQDDLGTEWDVTAVYAYSKRVSFDATVAFLTGADAIEYYTFAGDNDARMFTIGTNVSF